MTHTFEITETIEVEFPHFRKYEFFYYKVLDKNMEVKISYYLHEVETMNTVSISYDKICELNTFRKGSYEITEDEFNETFARACKLINAKNK